MENLAEIQVPSSTDVACAVRTSSLPPASFRAHGARYRIQASLVGWNECNEFQRWVSLSETQPTLLRQAAMWMSSPRTHESSSFLMTLFLSNPKETRCDTWHGIKAVTLTWDASLSGPLTSIIQVSGQVPSKREYRCGSRKRAPTARSLAPLRPETPPSLTRQNCGHR